LFREEGSRIEKEPVKEEEVEDSWGRLLLSLDNECHIAKDRREDTRKEEVEQEPRDREWQTATASWKWKDGCTEKKQEEEEDWPDCEADPIPRWHSIRRSASARRSRGMPTAGG